MGTRLALFIMVISLVVAMSYVHGPSEWLHKTNLAKEKVTKLHFYYHETGSGKNTTAVIVAKSPVDDESPPFFGRIRVMDDPLTLGPEPTSKLVGRAQGLYGLASLEESGLHMTMTFAFSYGKYNGSTLAIIGRNMIQQPLREMPIVGGTGIFRLARGIATTKTILASNATSPKVIAEYNISVIHY